MKVNVNIILVDNSVIRDSDIFDIVFGDCFVRYKYIDKYMYTHEIRIALSDIVSINLKFMR